MKAYFKEVLFISFFFVLFFSCQKELSFQTGQLSAGSLKNTANECLPKTVAGTYIVGKDLGDTNYIEVEVIVTRPGSWSISTNLVNGYSFKSTGIFSTTGSHSIRLLVTGKPLVAGNNDFTVIYDSGSCHIQVPVLPAAGAITPAAFTLLGAPNTCIPATVFGNYIKNAFLTSADTVSIRLNVTSPGSYAISTDTVNGYSFSGSGVLLLSGTQTISLTGTGAPLNAGINTFNVIAGTSHCTFLINVLTAISITSNDYFPLARSNYWTYDNLLNTGDTIRRIMTDTVFINGTLYRIMDEQDVFGTSAQSYFRKAGNDYFEYGSVDKFTASVKYTPEVNAEIPFLKQNLSNGESWATVEHTGTISSGQTVIVRYDFFCVDANAAVTVNGKAFINVYKIRMLPQVRSLFATLGYTGEIIDLYYAKGVGLIYLKSTRNGFNVSEWRIKNWKVY